MKLVLYCIECQGDGPTMTTTPVGPAFGTEENRQWWHAYVEEHADHSCAQFGLRTVEE